MTRETLRWRGLTALALLVALLAPSAALAGGVAVILDSPPQDVQAGVAFTFGFSIRSAHEDRTSQPGLKPLIIASNPATDEQVTATGKGEGDPGHYVATITFPSAGDWVWKAQPFPEPEYTLTLPGPLKVREQGAQAAAPQAPASAVEAAVEGLDDSFTPRELTIPAGTTVRWTMGGKRPHTVTTADGAFSSGNLDAGAAFSFTFTTPGTYAYYCEYHGGANGQGMAGKIVVTAAPAPAQAALPATGGASGLALATLALALVAAIGGLALRWRGPSAAR